MPGNPFRPPDLQADFDRRAFLRLIGMGTLMSLSGQLPIMGDPLDDPHFDLAIPADKKLDPAWVKSLFERGTPELFSRDQLSRIAMPIGGICTGQDLNLSGEGSMTLWRVFAYPMEIQQGFSLRITSGGKTENHLFNQQSFPDLTFRGEYPIAKVEYANAAIPVQVSLEAFSPFIPLNIDDSALPGTIFNYTLKNTSTVPVEVTLAGSLENAVCGYNRFGMDATRRNKIVRSDKMTVLECTADSAPIIESGRTDIIFEDWTKPTFDGWTVEGNAFGSGPFVKTALEEIFHTSGGKGDRCASSVGTPENTNLVGKLTSAPFTIQRRYLNLWLSGGNWPGKTCVNLVVDGQVVQSVTGRMDNFLTIRSLDVHALEGKQATLEIVDAVTGDWGHVTVGRIFFSDVSGDGNPLDQFPDYGSMALALMGSSAELGIALGSVGQDGSASNDASAPLASSLIGTIGRTLQLQPGESATVTFMLATFFPNLEMPVLGKVGRHYTTKFSSAPDVIQYLADHLKALSDSTRLWRDTWYDSTLPYWFLDRTFINVSTLATTVCYRFADGRFYAYEGGAAPNYLGTCTHVWQYAHSVARVFPALERDTRERVDLGVAFMPATGIIGYRGEYAMGLAVDGQAGTILRFYREHQMSPDNAFLKRNWDKIKLTYNPLFARDTDEDGILEGDQNNTLDCSWYGQISWMSSMYVAALRAGEQMAREMGDTDFAERCAKIATLGSQNITQRLYNGEYFFNIIDPKNAEWVNSGDGCHIDQVYGQSWAHQVGLPRVLPQKETHTALQSLWKYNFAPDARGYYEAHQPGRGFIYTGDKGMIMCPFPRTDWDYARAQGANTYGQHFAMYFNETWTGQEYQVASHMFWEGMVMEGLAIVRAIHDRYNPFRRNPWAEEEAGIHYSRAMASHGAFIGICGFEYHGPLGQMAFAPRLTPENFRGPFIAAEGWGTYSQTISKNSMQAGIEMKWGQLALQTLCLTLDGMTGSPRVKASRSGVEIPATLSLDGSRLKLSFAPGLLLRKDEKLTIEVG